MKVTQKHSDKLDRFESRATKAVSPQLLSINLIKIHQTLPILSLNHLIKAIILENKLKLRIKLA